MTVDVETEIGPRTEPPTDREVADPKIIAWQLQSSADSKPRLLVVRFIGAGEPRAWERVEADQVRHWYFRDYGWVTDRQEFERKWKLVGHWRPVHADDPLARDAASLIEFLCARTTIPPPGDVPSPCGVVVI